MKPDEMALWAKRRERGMAFYVLVFGVLAWGVPMFAVMTFVLNPYPVTPWMIEVSAAVWAVGGALFGTTMWWFAERRYRKALASKGA